MEAELGESGLASIASHRLKHGSIQFPQSTGSSSHRAFSLVQIHFESSRLEPVHNENGKH